MDGETPIEVCESDVVRACIKNVWGKCWVRKHMTSNVMREERSITNILKVLSLVFACLGVVCVQLPPAYHFVFIAIWLLSTFGTLALCMVRGGREVSLRRLKSNYSDQLVPLERIHTDAGHENRLLISISRFNAIQIALDKADRTYHTLNLSKEAELSLENDFNKLFE